MSYLLYIPGAILAIIFAAFIVGGLIDIHRVCIKGRHWLPLIVFYLILLIILLVL
jgi:hypothetical protein